MLSLYTYVGHVLCLFPAVTKGVMSPQWLSGCQQN
jgi:hypothetical protein